MMNNKLLNLFVTATVLAAVSCGEAEPVRQGEPIQFSMTEKAELCMTKADGIRSMVIPSTDSEAALTLCISDMEDPATKGTEITTSNLDRIGVIAKENDGNSYFSNVLFTKDDDGTMKHEPVYYWPNQELYCYLYYPYMDDEAENVWGFSLFDGSGAVPSVTYKTPSSALDHKDFCYGYCFASSGTPKVSMRHMLSYITFKVGDYIPIGSRLSSIRLNDILSTGSCTLAEDNPVWAVNPNKTVSTGMTFYPSDWVMESGKIKGDEIFSGFFVLPQKFGADSDASISIGGKNSSGTSLSYKFSLSGITFDPGEQYIFYINFPQ